MDWQKKQTNGQAVEIWAQKGKSQWQQYLKKKQQKAQNQLKLYVFWKQVQKSFRRNYRKKEAIEQSNDELLIVANMPQTPFQKENSRPDNNGGINSMKFNEQLVRSFSSFSPKSVLIMLYSYMCQPKKFFETLIELNLSIIWRSERTVFKIPAKAYDEMEENFSTFLKNHMSKGRAQVEIIQENGEDIFIVPAEILVIQKQQK